MKILHLCQRDHPDTGGSLRVAEALAHQQQKQGHEAWLVFLYGPPSEISNAMDPFSVCLGIESSRQIIKGLSGLTKALRQIKPDIVHLHDGITWPRLALLYRSCPVVMHAHLPVEPAMSFIAWFLIKKTTDHLIGISNHTIGSWVAAGFPREKITYVPNGVDFSRFGIADKEEKAETRRRLELPEDRKIVLWVGRLHREMKGVDRIEHIVTMLPADVTLVVVGNGPEFSALQKHCAASIEKKSLVLVGSTSTPENYYKIADAFLFTSHYEPFGLVILEAVASGLPIVSFPVDQGGGAVELLQEFNAVRVTEEMQVTEVRKVIADALISSDKREKSSELVISKYSWASVSLLVLSIYKSMLTRSVPITDSSLKVIVCQHGARHRYAIPRMLEEEGALAALYTDSSAESVLGKMSVALGRRAPDHLQRLAGRKIEGVPHKKIYSSDRTYIADLFQKLSPTPQPSIMLNYKKHKIIAARMRAWGLKGANVIYSMYHEDLDFLRWAKSQGVRCVVDVFICPVTDDILADECLAFPDWVEGNSEESNEFKRKLWRETADLADVLVCPSEWVADGVRSATPSAADKIRIVPYGCSIDYQGQVNKPVPGRILFAGGDALRKGLHYLAQATSILKKELPELDVRIAGNLPSSVVNHPDAKDLHFLGKLGGEQMRAEYLSADALALPALSEGFAGVVAEAIGAGCPVIVTKEAGSPIVHEREGLIITSRDVSSLVSAMRRMVTDRPFRQKCSESCLAEIPFYSEDAWKNRLVNVMKELC